MFRSIAHDGNSCGVVVVVVREGACGVMQSEPQKAYTPLPAATTVAMVGWDVRTEREQDGRWMTTQWSSKGEDKHNHIHPECTSKREWF